MLREVGSKGWVTKQFSDIFRGGIGVFFRKVRYAGRQVRYVQILNGVWAIPAVWLMRAARPIVHIRVGTIFSTRIGHFVSDATEQVTVLARQPANTVDWYWLGPTCNQQWEIMVRRTLTVRWWVKYVDWWNGVLPGGNEHTRPTSFTNSRDIDGLFMQFDARIPLLETESNVAQAWLEAQGWRVGEPFVCLLVRDSAYLNHDPLHGLGENNDPLLHQYHDYRDSDIDTYLPAVTWLASKGIWVLRMGKIMARPLPGNLEHVIDYAFDPSKSDLLDIWLFANCTACVSTASGPDNISWVYGRPVLYVNALPLTALQSSSHSTWVPKHLFWRSDGAAFTLSDYLVQDLWETQFYDALGVRIVDLDPDEILEAVQEFWKRIEGTWVETPIEQDRQERFWRAFQAWPDFSRYHGRLHPETRVGDAWLASQRPGFLEEGPRDAVGSIPDR